MRTALPIYRPTSRSGSFSSNRAAGELFWGALDHFRGLTFRVRGVDYAVPGFMLWAAISYAVVGSLLVTTAGRSLVRAQRPTVYAREAGPAFAARPHQRARRRDCARGGRGRRGPPVAKLILRMWIIADAPARPAGYQSHLGQRAGFGWVTV